MAAQSNGVRLRGSRRSAQEARTVLSAALKHSLKTSRTSQALAGRLCGRSARTIKRWLEGQQPVEVERVMTARRLWRPFLKCLVGIDRKAHWL